MKSKKLTYQENSKSIQVKLPKYIQKNREILRYALTKVGFQNYPSEFWHWSHGDYWWAKRANKNKAIYGPVEEVDGKN
jgi:D-alanyl-D-alanine dipeptidase